MTRQLRSYQVEGLGAEKLREILQYDPETGNWTWIRKDRRGIIANKAAGTAHGSGYVSIRIDGKSYLAHRLAFLWMTGNWPQNQIDHKNLVKDDNRWINLREATNSENHINTKAPSSNTSGRKGVSFNKKRGKWQVTFCSRYIGLFNDVEEAHAAYSDTARQHFGEFARAR